MNKLQAGLLLFAALDFPLNAFSDIQFHDIATNADTGISYSRKPSPELLASRQQLLDSGSVPLNVGMAAFPARWAGSPGVAIIDYDADGYQDIYVTNGPGKANSLFRNLSGRNGKLGFEDVALQAGVDATGQDSSGVCFGDIDNDGDDDLYVLGRNEANRLFENLGSGQFKEISPTANIAGNYKGSTTCSMGDVNNDGLLDIAVANTFDWATMEAISKEPFKFNQHNELFLNQGQNHFSDVSASSGIQSLEFPESSDAPPQSAGITWSISLVDIDQDGDVDLVWTDDQGAIRPSDRGGHDRGFIRVWENNGAGVFSELTGQLDMFHTGAWMSTGFSDFDCNGSLDIFGSNLGDYLVPFINGPYLNGAQSSKWLLQQPDGAFNDPGLGDLISTPFGWANVAFDYDNDGDADIAYFGGLDSGVFIDASNPGVILENHDCKANFTYAVNTLSTTDHTLRNVLGVAVGDLDNNGFQDIVSVANFDISPDTPMVLSPAATGSPFDETAFYVPTWVPDISQGVIKPNQPELAFQLLEGSMSVEMNNGGNDNNWIKVSLLGTRDLTGKGQSNRDGIGAVLSFTPEHGKTEIYPVLSGGSSNSQRSLQITFGLGHAEKGSLDILWPGGAHNRYANLPANQSIKFPEIPCNYDDQWQPVNEYVTCVTSALAELEQAKLIDPKTKQFIKKNALLKLQEHGKNHNTL